MPIYPGRRKGTWRVIIWVRNVSHEAIVEGTKKEAAAFEARRRLELDAADQPTTRTAPSFDDFCVQVYRPHAVTHLRPSTWGKVRIYQVETLCEHFGTLKLTQFTDAAIDAFKKTRLASKSRMGGTVKASSVNNELRVLRTILNFARERGYPVANIKLRRLPNRGPSRVSVWTRAEIERLCLKAREHTPEIEPLVIFLANTGCRKGEALAAEWAWVDIKRRMLRIPSNDVWRPKNGKPREVPLSDALVGMFSVPEEQRRHERWLFPSRHGGRYAEFPKERFWLARSKAKLDGGPHTLRHSFASLFLGAQPDMALLAAVLGHSTTRVTELYSHMLPEHLSRARNAVNIGAPAQPDDEAEADDDAEDDDEDDREEHRPVH